MKFLRTFFISFVVFGAAVYRPSSMVDYTERRREERLREKRKMFQINITSPPAHHREKKY
jgi:hypothetical protein